jgi:pimeloyl-ACP methyl ester carboxylesterase
LPFAKHRDQSIHYTVEGDGPLVVFQHGLLSDAKSWKETGFVDALADRYQVACVDSLGHGLSDKPTDPRLYQQQQRAGDIAAVIDALGQERAHLVGYSMGGWISVGVAKHYPERLASLTIGGWDALDGMKTARAALGEFDFDGLLARAGGMEPALTAWVTPEVKPGLRACFDELGRLDGAREAVLGLRIPVMIWDGRDDPYHGPMQAFAADNGLRFLSTSGDHLGAIIAAPESPSGIRAFLDSV